MHSEARSLRSSPTRAHSWRGLVALLVLALALPAQAQESDEAAPAEAASPEAASPEAASPEAAPPEAAPPEAKPKDNRTRFNYMLREVGTSVERHKEETFGTKSRLMLLRASVLRRSIAGSKVLVVHDDDMGGEYELVQVLYILDRERKLGKIASEGEDLDDLDGEIIVDEKMVPGSHLLTVKMVYRGATWGLFAYADGYTFTIESSYAFTAEEGKIHEINVTAFEGGDVFTPLEERPTIGYRMKQHDFEPAAPAANAKQ